MKTLFKLLPLSASLAFVGAGCVTTQDVQGPPPASQADVGYLREEIRRLHARIEASDAEVGRLLAETSSARASQPSFASASQVQSLQTQIDDLQRQIRALDAARAQDRRDITDDVAKRVAEIVASSRPSAPARAPAAARPATQSGYEHVVQPGESLSKIAAAYKVRVNAIVEANNLRNADSIFVGQKLFIPD